MPAVQVTEGYCYAELAVFSIVVAVAIASSAHYAYTQRGGQAELAGLNTNVV